MIRSLTLAAPARGGSIALWGLALTLIAACHQQWDAASRPSTPERTSTGSHEAAGAVTADELKGVRAKRVEELLAGRVSGVHVLPTPGGGFAVRIRGTGALPGDREPLYVVDGMRVEVAAGRGIDWLDPAEITRIDVLKDAVETLFYGPRGANGVVLITTKQSSQRTPRPQG